MSTIQTKHGERSSIKHGIAITDPLASSHTHFVFHMDIQRTELASSANACNVKLSRLYFLIL